MAPTVTFPKLTVLGAALSRKVCATPVPDSVTVAGELVAVLTTETLPEALPVTVGAKLAVKLVLWPAVSVRGSESPLMLNPVPVAVACEIVTLPVPLLVSVTVWLLLLPTVTFPKLRLVGVAPSRSVTPVPENETTAGELVAVLTTETLPEVLPVMVGAKVAVKLVLWPEVSVRGSESPLMLNPLPVTVACETVTLPVPLLVRVTVPLLLLLTVTFPKLRLSGVAPSRSVTPVPDSETTAGELVAVLTTETLPEKLPVTVGAKVAVKLVLWPAVRVRGSESPLMLNPAPVAVACETVTLPVPLLVRVRV